MDDRFVVYREAATLYRQLAKAEKDAVHRAELLQLAEQMADMAKRRRRMLKLKASRKFRYNRQS